MLCMRPAQEEHPQTIHIHTREVCTQSCGIPACLTTELIHARRNSPTLLCRLEHVFCRRRETTPTTAQSRKSILRLCQGLGRASKLKPIKRYERIFDLESFVVSCSCSCLRPATLLYLSPVNIAGTNEQTDSQHVDA